MAQMETIMPMNESAPKSRGMMGMGRVELRGHTCPPDRVPRGSPPNSAPLPPLRVSRFASAMYLLLILRITTTLQDSSPPSVVRKKFCFLHRTVPPQAAMSAAKKDASRQAMTFLTPSDCPQQEKMRAAGGGQQ